MPSCSDEQASNHDCRLCLRQECSTHGDLGAVVFLELAMALEATGQSYQAQDIYKVLARSKNRDVRTKARR